MYTYNLILSIFGWSNEQLCSFLVTLVLCLVPGRSFLAYPETGVADDIETITACCREEKQIDDVHL